MKRGLIEREIVSLKDQTLKTSMGEFNLVKKQKATLEFKNERELIALIDAGLVSCVGITIQKAKRKRPERTIENSETNDDQFVYVSIDPYRIFETMEDIKSESNFVVVAYFTKGTVYENYYYNLLRSCKMFDLSYKIVPVENQGNWFDNTQYKPKFLLEQLDEVNGKHIVYVDIDAVFCRYPDHFDKITQNTEIIVGCHLLDHSKYRRRNHPPELLSGTVYFRNNAKSREIIEKWIAECGKDSNFWDQRALDNVLKEYGYHNLPEEYCTIFDYMAAVRNPVIKHYQASRSIKNKKASLGKTKNGTKPIPRVKKEPRVVEKNGHVMIRRIK